MTVSSMTGFGRAAGAADGVAWVIEIRSVNGRGLDLRLRLPAPLDSMESEFRSRIQKAFTRGNIQVTASVRLEASAGMGRINEAAFLHYAEIAEQLSWSAKLAAPTIGDILRLPGVIEGQEAQPEDGVVWKRAVLTTLDAAMGELVASRQSEGEALARILDGLLDSIDVKVAEAETADLGRRDAIPERLRAQLANLLANGPALDRDRLHQEAVLLASRIDVREEIDRLKAHIAQARDHVRSTEPVGRKLDFLTQEFVRETNTLCSKANDLALTRAGLDLKALVEQFREQVQNIE